MAQQPDFQQILSQTNYSPTPISRRLAGSSEGVGGFAEGLSRVASVSGDAIKAYRTYQMNDVRDQIQTELRPLIEETLSGSPSYRQEQETDLALNQEILNTLPSTFGPEDPETLNNFISGVQQNVEKDVQFLSKAKNQKRMSEFEFQQRSLNIARKYLASNPGLRREILNTISNTFQDEGIAERIQFDDKLAKSEQGIYENEVKNIRDNFEKFNIPELPFRNPDGSLNIQEAQVAIDKNRNAKAARDAVMNNMDYNKRVTEEEVRQVETSGLVHQVVLGQYNEDTAAISSIFTANADNFPKAKLQAKAYLASQKLNFRSNPRISKYMGSQVVKENIEQYEKQIDALSGAMESFASNEDLQKFTQNSKSIMQDTQTMALMKDFDVPRMELAIKLGSVGNLINSKEGQEYIKGLIVNTRDIFSSGKLVNPSMFNNVPGTSQTGMSLMLQESLKGNNSEVTSQVINANIDAINDPKVSPNQLDAFTRADTFFKDISKPENMEKFIDADPNSVTKTIDLLSKYNEQIDIDLQRYFTTNPNKAVKLEVNPATGLVYAQGADADFNGRFTGRINNALKAYANIRTQTPKEVWKDFYQEFYPSISQGKTLSSTAEVSNNPLNLKDNQGQPTSFNSLEEAVSTYESILLGGTQDRETVSKVAAKEFENNKRLFEQKKITQQEFKDRASSLNNALKADIQAISSKPKSIKSIVDKFYETNKTGGMQDSREQAYKFLGDYLTKSPTAPLDLNDKETMAKVIAGMAKIESNTDLNWLRVASFLKKAGPKKSLSKTALESATKEDNFMSPGANE